jgi:hypothetical protein
MTARPFNISRYLAGDSLACDSLACVQVKPQCAEGYVFDAAGYYLGGLQQLADDPQIYESTIVPLWHWMCCDDLYGPVLFWV